MSETASVVTPEMLEGIANPFAFLIQRYARKPYDFVTEVVGATPDPWQRQVLMALQRGHTRISIRSGHGVGKAIAVSERILTWNRGWQRAGDVTTRDRLVAVDGTPTKILGIYPQRKRQLYHVATDDGASVVVDGDHLWLTTTRSERKHSRPGGVRTTRQIAESLTFPNGPREGLNHQLPMLLPIAWPEAGVPIDPWLLGAWLGDGSGKGRVSDVPLAKAELLEAAGARVRASAGPGRGHLFSASLGFAPGMLRMLGLAGCRSWEKFIPEIYLRGSIAQRTALLQGLLDTDGTVGRVNGNLSITTTSWRLRIGIVDLVGGLGGVVRTSPPRRKWYSHSGEMRQGRPCWVMSIALPVEIVPFRHPDKLALWHPTLHRNRARMLRRHISDVREAQVEEAVCFKVEHPDELFVVEGYIVTHNTAFLSWVLIWHILCRFPQKAICTAPSSPQLFDALWAELRAWIGRLPIAWQSLLDATSDRVSLRAAPEESFISARTSRAESPEAMAGVHSAYVLLIADEASGVPEAVFEAASGSMSTPGAITILTGNPTRSVGFFHRTHTVEAERWFTLRVSSADSPRVDHAFVEEVAARYGRDSNAFRVRVLGEFPASQGDTLIGAEVVESAMERQIAPDMNEPEIWGVDAARFGVDSSVLIKRRGKVVMGHPLAWVGIDTMQLTGQIANEYNRVPPAARPKLIVVDAIGIGAGVEDRLRELDIPCMGLNVAETPSVQSRFRRLRDEVWQSVADWLETRLVSLPWHERLRDDLVGPRYKFLSDGRLVVESKPEMRARGLPSPDYADALGATFAPGAATAMAFRNMRWNRPIRRNIRGLV